METITDCLENCYKNSKTTAVAIDIPIKIFLKLPIKFLKVP